MPGRTLAIGDIHGCSAALERLLDALELRDDDMLITLGDAIDRGPDSQGVIDLLIEARSRCRLVPILGNHDQVLLNLREGSDKRKNRLRRSSDTTWISMGGLATLGSYGAGWGELDAIPEAHYDFLRSCLPAYETETHLFFHAQYDPDLPIDRQTEMSLRWRSLREVVPAPHISGKRAIVGHTAQKNGEVLDLGHILCIDTFCYGGGWLTALDVGSGRTWQADAHGRLRDR
jgi:serine/threonine protein phosphatase 1